MSSKTPWRHLEDILKGDTSQVTTASSTEASVITALQVGHFTVVSNDFISTGKIFANFITFSLITWSTNCTSRIASSSNTTVELVVILKYLSLWLECILKLIGIYDFPSSTLSTNCEWNATQTAPLLSPATAFWITLSFPQYWKVCVALTLSNTAFILTV